jgi:hypothetical protein
MQKGTTIRLFFLTLVISCYAATEVTGGSSGGGAERIFLQTDREVYIAGENLFYRIDLADTSGLSGQLVYLVLRNTRNRGIEHALVRTRRGKAWGNIYLPDTLSTGRYQVVAYTNVMRNYGPECFAAKDIVIANRFDRDLKGFREGAVKMGTDTPETRGALQNSAEKPLRVIPAKKAYGPREKITLDIQYSPAEGDTLISVSVSVAEAFSRMPAADGRVVEKGRNDPETAGKRGTTGRDVYLPEYEGYILRGRVLEGDSTFAQGVYVMLSVPDSLVNLDYAVTDSSGRFRFLLSDYYFGKKLILIPRDLSHTGNYKIVPEDKFAIPQPYRPDPVLFPPGFRAYLSRCQDIVGIQKIYGQQFVLTGKNNGEKKEVRPLLYSTPTMTVVPDDYTPLNDLPEISKEIIPLLKIRKKGEQYEVRILDVPGQVFFKQNAAIFLDGVPADDFRQLVPLDSKQISRIEVVAKQWFYGDLRFPGILAVFTRNHAVRKYHFSPEVQVVKMERPAEYASMIMPRYDVAGETGPPVPDLRQVLCWIPDLELKKNRTQTLSFYSGDLSGSYLVRVTGITRKGERIMATTRFVVQKGENSAANGKNGGE